MDHIGQIVGYKPGKTGYAIVQMRRHSACGDCGACQMGEENMDLQVEAVNFASAQIGDWVVIELGHQSVIKAAFIAYTIPLVVLVLSIVLGVNVFTQFFDKDFAELLSFGLGVLLTGVCYAVIQLYDKKFQREGKFQSIITRTVSEQECEEEMKEDGQ